VRKLALRFGQLEIAVVQDRRQRRSHLDAGESGSETLMRSATPWREHVGASVFVTRRAMAIDVEVSVAAR
jgi:hypothetical protein